MRKRTGWMAALLLWAALVPCAAAESKRYETSFLDVFDTFSQVVVYADTQEAAQEILQAVHDELKVYHRLFDIYQAYEGVNNLYTVNQNAGIAPVAVEQPLYDLLTFGKEIYAQTGGKTNIALGSVLSIWHEYRELGLADPEHAAVPSAEELYRAGEHTDIDQMVLNPEKRTVYLTDPEMSLDVGAIAKGYAVELTARKMEARGVDSLPADEHRRQSALHRAKGRRNALAGGSAESRSDGAAAEPCGDRPDGCFAGDQRQLSALLHGGRQAVPPHYRPGDPLPGRTPLGRFRMDSGFRAGGRAVHRPVCDAAG